VIDGGTQEPQSERRRALVAAAFRRLAAHGFEGLRTRDVAADAGVNIATLHYYFPSKEALIRGVIGFSMQRFMATMPTSGRSVDQLRGHLQALRELLKQERDLWSVMGELVLRAPRDADLERIFRDTDAYWHRTLADLIRRSIDEGALDASVSADNAAALMIVAIRGLSLPTGRFQPDLVDKIFSQFDRLLGFANS
jgi:AcrR family transcriptional regulator